MKKLLNKKGFTLVELLAVIVVLAIIMLVVANRVGDAMKTARGNSLMLQAQSIQKELNQYCILNNVITENNITSKLGSGNSFDLVYMSGTLENNSNGFAQFDVQAEKGSKFANINAPEENPSGITLDKTATDPYLEPIVTIELDCPIK